MCDAVPVRFNLIVLFVMLNILLAIIMDTYVLVKQGEEGADSIVTQGKKTSALRQLARGTFRGDGRGKSLSATPISMDELGSHGRLATGPRYLAQ